MRGSQNLRRPLLVPCPTQCEVIKVIQVLEFNNLRSNITIFGCFGKNFFWHNHENSCWILAPFLSEAVEARLYYFFKNRLIKTKCHNILNRWLEIWKSKSKSVSLSELIYFTRFNVRHPVRAMATFCHYMSYCDKQWMKMSRHRSPCLPEKFVELQSY